MTEKEIRPLLMHLETLFPGYRRFKRMLIAHPVRDMLQGFFFDSSDWDKAGFYASVFVQPLFVPFDDIILSFSKRLKPGTFHLDEEEALVRLMKTDGLTFLHDFPTTECGKEMIPELRTRMLESASTQRMYAFMLARLGDREGAVLGLDRATSITRETRMEDGKFVNAGWARMVEENLLLRDLLIRDESAAQRQLDEWRAHTIRALKLEKMATPTPSVIAS